MTDLLIAEGISKSFGSVRAVDDCSIAVAEGSITALIGPNGSGKTTLFNTITGYLRADAGRIHFAGRDVTGLNAGQLYRRGLSRTFQQARIFPELTVRENLVVAAGDRLTQLFGRRVSRGDRAKADGLIDDFGLGKVADLAAAQLSYGQRKLVEFASVLMSGPRLVLLDEPTAGVNPTMIQTMERHIRERNADGISFLVVEHDMGFVMRLCDPVVVLDRGRRLYAGRPEDVQSSQQVLDAYLGA